MNEEEKIIVEDVEKNRIEEEKKARKEEFDSILEKIRKMSDAIEFHTNVKEAVSKEEVDSNYLKYIENSLEDKFFCDAKFDKIKSKVLLEVVCPELENIEKFEVPKLEIEDIGSHLEEQENYIDKICTYDGKFICVFGINETNPEKVMKYEKRKFIRTDMIEATCKKLEEGKMAQIEQHDELMKVKLKYFQKEK